MPFDDDALLISEEITRNEYEQEIKTEKQRQILCRKSGITRAEFFSAGRQGLNPQFVITTAAIDYNGETVLEYRGERFGIYRTYPSSADYIELYCEKKGGLQP